MSNDPHSTPFIVVHGSRGPSVNVPANLVVSSPQAGPGPDSPRVEPIDHTPIGLKPRIDYAPGTVSDPRIDPSGHVALRCHDIQGREPGVVDGEDYYNYHRPHGGLAGQTPYERLRQITATPAVTDERQSHTFSHRRVEPSTSVNRNVTTPEGAAAAGADTPAESHNRRAPTSHIGGIRAQTPHAPR